jgi:hypothetical protein
MMVRTALLGGVLCSLPLSAWSANLLQNASFNKPAQGVPLGTTVSFTGCHDAGNSAAAGWLMWIISCDPGFNDISTTLVPSTLPGSTGYMQHIVTDGNANGVYQNTIPGTLSTLTSVWVYLNSGCVSVGTGFFGNTGSDDIFCVPGKWFRIPNVPNGVSPTTEIVIYSANWLPGANGADFYVKNASVVAGP